MEKKAIVYIFYNKDADKFLVENRTMDQSMAGEKVFPGGKVEPGELHDLSKTLIRETKEELGVEVIEYVVLNPAVVGIGGFLLYTYLVTIWKGIIPEKVLDKGSKLEWINRRLFNPNLKPVQQLLRIANNYIESI